EWSRRPLVIIELGASAGLNLMWDQYRYEYEGDASCGPSDATVVIRSAFRGDRRPRLPERAPAVVGRVGVDLVPIDVRDEDQTSWLRGVHPLVELTSWAGANVTTRRLVFSDPHGRWIEWLGDRTAARPFE